MMEIVRMLHSINSVEVEASSLGIDTWHGAGGLNAIKLSRAVLGVLGVLARRWACVRWRSIVFETCQGSARGLPGVRQGSARGLPQFLCLRPSHLPTEPTHPTDSSLALVARFIKPDLTTPN